MIPKPYNFVIGQKKRVDTLINKFFESYFVFSDKSKIECPFEFEYNFLN